MGYDMEGIRMKIIATNKETGKTYDVLMFHVEEKLQVWVKRDNSWWENADKYDYNYEYLKLS